MKKINLNNPYGAYVKLNEAEYHERMRRNNINSFILLLSHFTPSKKSRKSSPKSSVYVFLAKNLPAELYLFRIRKASEFLRKRGGDN